MGLSDRVRKLAGEAAKAVPAARDAVQEAAARVTPAMKDAAGKVAPAVKGAASRVVPVVKDTAGKVAPVVADAASKAVPAVCDAAVNAAQAAVTGALRTGKPAAGVAAAARSAATSAAKRAAGSATKAAVKAATGVAVKNASGIRDADSRPHTVHNERTGQDVLVEAYVKRPGGGRDYGAVYPSGAKGDFGAVGNKAVGMLLVMAGIPMLVLPGPGTAAIAAGLYFLTKKSGEDDGVLQADVEVGEVADPVRDSAGTPEDGACDTVEDKPE